MISINTNIPSLIAQRSLNNSTKLLNQAIERMTTGFKINHASDNAANFSITTNMNTKLSSYQVAEDNVAMGLDLLSTAGGSLDLISDKLTRLRALAEQSANGTYGEQSLKAINSEANAIVDEIERIYSTAEYNGIKLFGESESKFIKPVEHRDTSTMTKLSSVDPAKLISSGTYSISTAEELAQLATMTNNAKVGSAAEFVLANDIDLSVYSSGEGWVPIGGANSNIFKSTFDGNGYVISNMYINRPEKSFQGLFGYTISANIKNLGVENINVEGSGYVGGLVGEAGKTTITNCYASGRVTGNLLFGAIVGHDNDSTITNCYYEENPGKNIINFQIGINSDSLSQITLDTAFVLDIVSLRGIGLGGDYLSQIDNMISTISSKQTEYGAVENRLESALEEISTQYDNLVSSRSTLRDADIAEVSSEYIRQQILQQASATLMATANQSPSLALQLI